jgi:hypothetical protein
MKDQHKKITGYRDLSQIEINAMNNVKELGNEIGKLIEEMETIHDIDQRWVAIAKTDLQKGVMAAVRAIAQPTSF